MYMSLFLLKTQKRKIEEIEKIQNAAPTLPSK